MSHLHVILFSPIGLTKVVKNPASRPKSWNKAMPRDLSVYGHISTKYAAKSQFRSI